MTEQHGTDAWRRFAAAIAPGAAFVRVQPLGGGLATSTYAIELSEVAPIRRLVVKIYNVDDDTAPMEWERLHYAQRVAVAVPKPVALDLDGTWFGTAAIVMTRLDGAADVTPRDAEAWIAGLAGALAAIHEADTSDAAGELLRPSHVASWQRPARLPRGALVERVVTAIERWLPSCNAVPVLTHGDFHPGNTLWKHGALTGVVDWSATRLAPRWYEVSYCRTDVALLLGTRAANTFVEHYVAATGLEPADLPVFDLVCGLRARTWASEWLRAYRQQGCRDSMRDFANRLTPFLRQALAELGG